MCFWVSEYQWWSRINFSWAKQVSFYQWGGAVLDFTVALFPSIGFSSSLWVLFHANLHGVVFSPFFFSLLFLLSLLLPGFYFFVFKSAQITERDKYPHLHSWPPGWSHQVHGMHSFPSHSVADYWWSRQVNSRVFRLIQCPLHHNSLNIYLKIWEGVILIHSCSVASAKHQMSGIRMKYPLLARLLDNCSLQRCHAVLRLSPSYSTFNYLCCFCRILDLGFEKDVAVILNALNAERETRQNVLLSATLTEGGLWTDKGSCSWIMHRQLQNTWLSLPPLEPSLKPFLSSGINFLFISVNFFGYGISFITGISVSECTSMVSTYVSQIS